MFQDEPDQIIHEKNGNNRGVFGVVWCRSIFIKRRWGLLVSLALKAAVVTKVNDTATHANRTGYWFSLDAMGIIQLLHLKSDAARHKEERSKSTRGIHYSKRWQKTVACSTSFTKNGLVILFSVILSRFHRSTPPCPTANRLFNAQSTEAE